MYINATDDQNNVHVALVMGQNQSGTYQVIIHFSFNLELHGAVIVAKLLHHVAKILEVPLSNLFA